MKKFFSLLGMIAVLSGWGIPAQAAWVDDERIKQKLEEQYAESKEIHGRYDARYYWDTSDQVKIEVMDGVVTLRGLVQDSEAKRAYERIARETPGVKEVVVKIRVVPSERKVD